MKVFTAPGKKPGHGAGGDILYKEKKFKNFELSVDWKTGKIFPVEQQSPTLFLFFFSQRVIRFLRKRRDSSHNC